MQSNKVGDPMASWRVAKSLDTLLGQLNSAFPKRSKKSDGSVGDLAHASRASDHNPNASGVVTARDFTHDPAGGLDCNWLAAQLVASKDPRIKYVIWNRRIWNAKSGWVAYRGSNPHDKHLHLSVSVQPGWFDSTLPWSFAGSPSSPVTTLPVQEDDMPTAAEIAKATWEYRVNTGQRVVSAEVLLANADNFANGAVAAIINGILDAPIDRTSVGRPPTKLRSVLAWSDTNIDRIMSAATEAAASASGTDPEQVAAAVSEAVAGAVGNLRITVASES